MYDFDRLITKSHKDNCFKRYFPQFCTKAPKLGKSGAGASPAQQHPQTGQYPGQTGQQYPGQAGREEGGSLSGYPDQGGRPVGGEPLQLRRVSREQF